MLRKDFVSNSSSSSFIFDKESYDKITDGDTFGLEYHTFNLHSLFDIKNCYKLDIELGPSYYWNRGWAELSRFRAVEDKQWIHAFMQGMAGGYLIPASLSDYIDRYKESYYINNLDCYKVRCELLEQYEKDVIEKILKPNVPDMELISLWGADDEHNDDDYENDEEKVRSICYDISAKGVKFYRSDTSH